MIAGDNYPMSRAFLYEPMRETGAPFAEAHAREAGRRLHE
jgi:hypothetical protein